MPPARCSSSAPRSHQEAASEGSPPYLDLHLRVGLNSGEAVVGRVGEDLRIDREEFGRLRDDRTELEEAARLYLAIGAAGHARRLDAELTGSPGTTSTVAGDG